MTPAPGTKLLRFMGERLRMTLEAPAEIGAGARAFLRTSLTRAALLRAGAVAVAGLREQSAATFAGAAWRDIPLERGAAGFTLELALLELGSFRAKPTVPTRQAASTGPSAGTSSGPRIRIACAPRVLAARSTSEAAG